jgi:hypothetical protein
MQGLLVVSRLRLLMALLSLVLLASCGAGAQQETFRAPGQEDSRPPAADNADLFEFSAPRLGGGSQVTGSELRGKDVALWFWAPW